MRACVMNSKQSSRYSCRESRCYWAGLGALWEAEQGAEGVGNIKEMISDKWESGGRSDAVEAACVEVERPLGKPAVQ